MVTPLLTGPVLLCLPTCFYSGSAWGLPSGQSEAQLPTVSCRGSQLQLGVFPIQHPGPEPDAV